MRRAPALVVLVLIGTALGVLVGLRIVGDNDGALRPSPGPNESAPTVLPSPTGAGGQGTTTAAVPATPRSPTTEVGRTPLATQPSAGGANANAEQVARNFITGFASYNWSDQPSPLAGQLQRARPWVTDDYYATLNEAREPPFLTSQRIAAQETQTVSEIAACDLSTLRNSDTLKVYRCTFILSTQSLKQTPSGKGPIWDITLINRDDGWFVDRYDS